VFSVVLALAVGLTLTVRGEPARVSAQQVAPPDRGAVVTAFLNAENNADVDGAVAQFADRTYYVRGAPMGACSQQTPCTDLAGVRQLFQSDVAGHDCWSLHWMQVSGAVVTGEAELRNDAVRATGVERIVLDFFALVPQDKITSYASVANVADADSALYAATLAGTQSGGTPIPAPTTACSPVS